MKHVARARLAASWLLALYFADMYVRMGWIKFDPDGFWTAAFVRWGYPPWLRIAIGCAEVAGGVLLVVPWTASPAASCLCFVMCGAWLTRFLDGRYVDVAWISVYILGLMWIGFEWRGFAKAALDAARRRPAQ